MHAMGQGFDAVYEPNADKVFLFAQRYEKYKVLGKFISNE